MRFSTRSLTRLVLAASIPLAGAAAASGPVDDSTPQTPCAGSTPLAGEFELGPAGTVGGLVRLAGTFVPRPTDEATSRQLSVAGEVTRGEHLIETFRVAWPDADPRAPLPFLRLLPPGHYRLTLVVRSESEGTPERCFAASRDIDLPAGAGAASAAEADADPHTGTMIRLLPAGDRLLTGRTRVEARSDSAAVAAVAFELDGRRVMTRTRPPWSVELDLGSAPRLHSVTAVALAADGRELARDSVPLNAGPHRFAVRLSAARPSSDRLEVDAVVDHAPDVTVDRVEFEVDGVPRVTLHQPPWRTPIALPSGPSPSWVRAVAWLTDGGAAEAVRLVDGGALGEQVDVDLVELLVTVSDRRGRPVGDLTADQLSIREDGRPQELLRFERVEDSPIHAAVMLDLSASMADDLPAAERAAHAFFASVLTPRDRIAVFTFGDRPRLATPFTNSLDRLAGGLAALETSQETALYDSLAFALHYFAGLGGRRSLVVLSDGEDSASRTTFDELLDFARRTGVTIYTIGIDVPTRAHLPGLVLDRLAAETGGRSYRISGRSRLEPIFESIEAELRSQYRLVFQSDADGGEAFRRLEVQVRRPGTVVRAPAGYYP